MTSTVLKSQIRRLAFRAGVLAECHRFINANRLTVVMFHRVLPPQDSRWSGADPEYTLSNQLFAAAIGFLRHHYSIVSLGDLFGSLEGHGLPSHPLLITLDDGWADTAEYALPELSTHALPAVVFVTAAVVGREEAFWQESLYAAWRAGHITVGQLAERAARFREPTQRIERFDDTEESLRRCIAALAAIPAEMRDPIVGSLGLVREGPAQMLNRDQLRLLASSRVAVGVHGYSHEPLTEVDAMDELTRARTRLQEFLPDTQRAGLRALSFPHGRYDAAVLEAATSAGYRLMFTSEPVLTPLSAAHALTTRVLGRIDVPASAITRPDGEFSPDRAASWLFFRSSRHLPPLSEVRGK